MSENEQNASLVLYCRNTSGSELSVKQPKIAGITDEKHKNTGWKIKDHFDRLQEPDRSMCEHETGKKATQVGLYSALMEVLHVLPLYLKSEMSNIWASAADFFSLKWLYYYFICEKHENQHP